MRHFKSIILFAAGALLVSCHDEPVVAVKDIPEGMASMAVNVDWSSYDKEPVSGFTAFIYDENGDMQCSGSTNNIERYNLNLFPSKYKVICVNQSPSEFSGMQFTGMNNFETAAICFANSRNDNSWCSTTHVLAAEPDWIATDNAEGEVLDDMVAISHQDPHWCKDHDCYHYSAIEPLELVSLHPRNVIWTLLVNVEIKNIESLSMTRAYLAGLASGVSLVSGNPMGGGVQHVMMDWRFSRYRNKESVEYDGEISSSIKCFGIPGVRGPESPVIFHIEMMMKDGKTLVKSDFDCTDNLDVDSENRIIRLNLSLSEPLPSVNVTGGFSADVSDWIEAEDINLGGGK